MWKEVKDFKAEVKVGDVIRYEDNGCEYKVTAIGENNFLRAFNGGECIYSIEKVFCKDSWQVLRQPERWRAKNGGGYWALNRELRTCSMIWDIGNTFDDKMFLCGNYFRTRQQANEASRRVQKTLMEYQQELLGEPK